MSVAGWRIGCVQLHPLPGQVSKNVERVAQLTEGLAPGTLDLLVLPEMALTGYIFADSKAIEHLLEDPYQDKGSTSPSFQIARKLAIQLECYVVVGFPMKSTSSAKKQNLASPPFNARLDSFVSQPLAIESQGYYNSAMLVDSRGELVHVFRKHFNYQDDKRWASEGPGFESIHLPGLGRICIAICMDLNPYDFKAPFHTFELATYCQQENVDILIMPMAWLLSDTKQDMNKKDDLSGEFSEENINYWATRLFPYLQIESIKQDFYFVCCNRTGTEQGSKFAGSSCALHFKTLQDKSKPTVSLLGAMSRKEGVQIFRSDQHDNT